MSFAISSSGASREQLVRVSIVEDQTEIRESLAELIAASPGFACAGAFDSMEALLAQAPSLAGAPPDVALMDIGLPGMDGIEGIRRIRALWSRVSPVMLTVHDDDERILLAIVAGANGYLLKSTSTGKLLEAIRESAGGGSPMSPEIARRVLDLLRRPSPGVDYRLTPHEQRILALLVSGENYKTAAARLKVSVNTISYHVRHIYEKLQVHSRADAIAKALRAGLVK
jgi:DNA-binding NarL/FixJ family response regulator